MSASSSAVNLETLLHGCEGVYSREELRDRLASGKRLRVKLGMDPTAPDLTLGHTVVLRKLLGGDRGARVEAWRLSLWYLELVLLWLFDYQGNYFDRCDNNELPGLRAKKVPWSTTPPASN